MRKFLIEEIVVQDVAAQAASQGRAFGALSRVSVTPRPAPASATAGRSGRADEISMTQRTEIGRIGAPE